ncbi:hypothetical protein HMI54_008720, partial [Coelomomyces lativittatus]
DWPFLTFYFGANCIFYLISNRFKRSNQVSLRVALYKTDFTEILHLKQWLEREVGGTDTTLSLTGGFKNLSDVRVLKKKLMDKLKGAENTYKKALEYLTTNYPPASPGTFSIPNPPEIN